MNAFIAKNGILVLLTFFSVSLLLSCSKKIYPEKPAAVIKTQEGNLNNPEITKPEIKPSLNVNESKVIEDVSPTGKKEIDEFITAGAGKSIAIPGVSPEQIIETAEKYLGVRHCMGGTTMKCIDCSGLLMVVFAAYGVSLPHNSQEQARYGIPVRDKSELKRGDLVFFSRSYKTRQIITHSGICTGDGKFIHTSSSRGVIITPLSDPYWSKRFAFGTRIFE